MAQADGRQLALLPFRIGMVIPLSGSGGIFGPSCVSLSEMAADELNSEAGIGGRQIQLTYIDGGRAPKEVAAEVGQLLERGQIDAVTGWHISSVRHALARTIQSRVPYVYTSLYEGGEYSAGIYCSGETPEQQILPGMRWMRDELGIRRWCVIGANYSWPLGSFASVVSFAKHLNVEIVKSDFIDVDSSTLVSLIRDIARTRCQAVLIMLVGQDAVDFNRVFAQEGLDDSVVRFSPLMDENMLLASGESANHNLYSAASYFRSLTTQGSLDLVGAYTQRVGMTAPVLNNMAQSCYQGIYTLANLTYSAGSYAVRGFDAVIDGMVFDSPRGEVRFEGNQAVQKVHLAKAEAFDFDVIDTF